MQKYLRFLAQPPITRQFKHKLKENFHTLTPGEMIIYFLFVRPFWNKQKRFFLKAN